jgi:uncharacterized protein with HEPN domain
LASAEVFQKVVEPTAGIAEAIRRQTEQLERMHFAQQDELAQAIRRQTEQVAQIANSLVPSEALKQASEALQQALEPSTSIVEAIRRQTEQLEQTQFGHYDELVEAIRRQTEHVGHMASSIVSSEALKQASEALQKALEPSGSLVEAIRRQTEKLERIQFVSNDELADAIRRQSEQIERMINAWPSTESIKQGPDAQGLLRNG